MKKINILLCLAFALPLLLCTSCLKDQEDLFDEPSSLRMQATIDNAKTVLRGADKGWLMELYPESTQGYGGYVFTIKFDSLSCTVKTELSDDSATSYYKITNDDGPVLTFDTYNELLHYFSTPSSSAYQGFEGEFEFIVMEATPELVTLKGKKTGNTIYLRPLSVDADEYISSVADMADNLIVSSANGTVSSNNVSMAIDWDYRQVEFTSTTIDSLDVSSAFCITDKGIRLYEPVTIGSETVSELSFDYSSLTFSADNTSLVGVLPDHYRRYDVFAGDYTLAYYNGRRTKDVTLTPSGDGSTYLMSGLNSKFDVVLKYSKSKGCLEMNSQAIGTYSGGTVWLCAWGIAGGGTLTWATSAGMYLVWNDDEENPVYTFETNSYTGLVTDSFILWGITSAGSSAGQMTDSSWYVNGSSQMRYLNTLTKK